MCDLSLNDRADLFRRTWYRAAKPHRCTVCRAVIPKGVRYQVTFVAYEGTADSAKSCRACAGAIERFGNAHRFLPFPDSFREFLEECVGDSDGARWRPMLKRIEHRLRRARAA